MPDNLNDHFLAHDFPPAFPPDFPLDTPHIYQAIEEHNRERMQCGLPAQNFSQLSPAERHDVLCRANTIKLLSVAEVFGLPPRPLPVALAAPKNEKEREMALLEREGKHFNVLGWVFLLAGISSFLVMVIQILK